jgi:hypothetical protein
MVFCVLAGLSVRVLAGSDLSAHVHERSAEDCCENHCHSPNESDPGPHDTHPHHHDGCCMHAIPLLLGIEPQQPCRLGVPHATRMKFCHEGDTPPDEPFLRSEKPPLI